MSTRPFKFPVVIVLILLFAFPLNIRAQSPKTVSKNVIKKAKKLSTRQIRMLHLQNDQIIKIKAINLDIAGKMNHLYASGDLAKNQKTEQLQALINTRNSEYQDVMNASQFQRWNDWQIKHPVKMKNYQ